MIRSPVRLSGWSGGFAALGLALAVGAAAAPKRALEVDDFDRLVAVDSLSCSRDGRWIAYTVEGSDLEADERKSSVWMVDFQGTSDLRLTSPRESASNPSFSPDGRWLVSSSRDGTSRLWEVRLKKLMSLARSTAGRELTAEERRALIPGGVPIAPVERAGGELDDRA